MSGDQLFKQFIDRILRCREAEDEAKEDTKAVYAELKAAGFDKTIAGKFVNELRQKEKNPDKFSETDTILDLYREAYERASHTHAREADQSKGEINGPEVEPAASSFDEIAETNSNSSEPIQSPEAETDKAGDSELLPAIPAAPIEDDFAPPAFLRKEVA